MTASLSQVLSGPMTIPWQGGHGSFSIVNLNISNALTVGLIASDVPGETIVLSNYGDNLAVDPVALSAIEISAVSYPAACSYILSALVGLAAVGSAQGVGIPIVYSQSILQSPTTSPTSYQVDLTGNGGAPPGASQFWLEAAYLSYSTNRGDTFPPTAHAWVTLALLPVSPWPPIRAGTLALVVTPTEPVSGVDMKHLALQSSTLSYEVGSDAAGGVNVYLTVLFSAQ